MNPIDYASIYSYENLIEAWYKVTKRKSGNPAITAFAANLENELNKIAALLKTQSYIPEPHRHFTIYDPKERLISVSSVRDRIVQHALMNIYGHIFERHLIRGSFACIKNRGTHKALLKAFHYAKSSAYFLKMDVRKYFDSIHHIVLKDMLKKIIKDSASLNLFYIIIDSSSVSEERGLPIGNLTSQYFANHYLSCFDHYAKEKLHIKKYIRYMDDILIFAGTAKHLHEYYNTALSYFTELLKLELKPAVISTVTSGAPFLGFLIKKRGIYLTRKSKERYKKRLKEIEHNLKRGKINEDEAGSRITSVTAHISIARSLSFRNTQIKKLCRYDILS